MEVEAEPLQPTKRRQVASRCFLPATSLALGRSTLGATVVDRCSIVNDTGRHDYRVLDLRLGGEIWRYLRMENASLRGTYHLEGIPGEINSVRGAILWRAGIAEEDVSDDGDDWYQQGDVVLIPKDAKRLRPFPRILT